MKLNYAIVCYKDNDDDQTMEIKHICCYENEPSETDVESLVKELREEEAFGLVGDDDYSMMLLDRSDEKEAEMMEKLDIPLEIDTDDRGSLQ
jgi:hypothetical protein